MGWQTYLMKLVLFELKVVYNDDDADDDDNGDNKPYAITKHVGLHGNEYVKPTSTMDLFPIKLTRVWRYCAPMLW